MNFRRVFISIIIFSIFVTGCAKDKEKTKNVVADKATQQKTMTKVQNDVNEIMNKDYNYVIKNMGKPYCATYYIDLDIIDESNIKSLSELNQVTNMRLIYPKSTSSNELEKSALYIELNSNNVSEVQTYEFSEYDIKDGIVDEGVDLIIDMYDEQSNLSLKSVQNLDFKSYVGGELDKLNNIIDTNLGNFEAYDRERKKSVIGYLLKDNNDKNNKILTIYETNNKIDDIKIIDSNNIVELVKKYITKN